MFDHLHSESFRRLTTEEAIHVQQEAQQALEEVVNSLIPLEDDPKLNRFLKTSDKAFAKPYLLLKLHKLKTRELKEKKLPPTRMIVPCFGTIAERLSRYIDQELYPWYKRLCEHNLPDTPTLIRMLEGTTLPRDCILSVEDYNALYPSITIDKGLNSLQTFLLETTLSNEEIRVYVRAMKIVMKSSILCFKENLYLQTKGTAIGNPAAVIFANVHVYMTTRELILKYQVRGCLIMYKRLIDDVFAIFTDEQSRTNFWIEHSRLDEDLQTEGTFGHSVNVLDLTVYKGTKFKKHNRLDFMLYRKKHYAFQYLPFRSFHDTASKKAWIASELKRIIKASDSFDKYIECRAIFLKKLLDRQYPVKLLEKICKQVTYNQRHDLLYSTSKRAEKKTRPAPNVFISQNRTQYNDLNLTKTLRLGWNAFTRTRDPQWETQSPILAKRATVNLFSILRKLLPL